jgi:hypothetical protein
MGIRKVFGERFQGDFIASSLSHGYPEGSNSRALAPVLSSHRRWPIMRFSLAILAPGIQRIINGQSVL